ncbi:hypothetical protein [Synechococcus sp. PCC 7502]|uniref:hypothetical protein n=1 Tax=Synechococcus sp. PCC 7502 TaxID=1173263 RepID=UPI00143907E7|nr:hypothetical protein [Synechococcus sp. PCC 7502]
MQYHIPSGAQGGFCKRCKARIFWIETKNKNWMPVEPDGTPHWARCVSPNFFRRSA